MYSTLPIERVHAQHSRCLCKQILEQNAPVVKTAEFSEDISTFCLKRVLQCDAEGIVAGELGYCSCCTNVERQVQPSSRQTAVRLAHYIPPTHIRLSDHRETHSFTTIVIGNTRYSARAFPVCLRLKAACPQWRSTGTNSARLSATTRNQNSPSMPLGSF